MLHPFVCPLLWSSFNQRQTLWLGEKLYNNPAILTCMDGSTFVQTISWVESHTASAKTILEEAGSDEACYVSTATSMSKNRVPMIIDSKMCNQALSGCKRLIVWYSFLWNGWRRKDRTKRAVGNIQTRLSSYWSNKEVLAAFFLGDVTGVPTVMFIAHTCWDESSVSPTGSPGLIFYDSGYAQGWCRQCNQRSYLPKCMSPSCFAFRVEFHNWYELKLTIVGSSRNPWIWSCICRLNGRWKSSKVRASRTPISANIDVQRLFRFCNPPSLTRSRQIQTMHCEEAMVVQKCTLLVKTMGSVYIFQCRSYISTTISGQSSCGHGLGQTQGKR